METSAEQPAHITERFDAPRRRVLFLCTNNSCRSQMAEAILRHLASDRFESFSAGTNPTTVNPDAVAVLHEIGIDISAYRSKPVAVFAGQSFSYVITVCDHAREQCPLFPGAGRQLHWSFEDPGKAKGNEQERRAFFRRVRDEITQQIRYLISDYL